MSVKEIPKNEWEEFFRDFTRFHQGWIASVDIFSRDLGAQKEANEMVFTGLVAGTRHDSRITIEVMLGETTDNHIRHTIATPTHVIEKGIRGKDEKIKVWYQLYSVPAFLWCCLAGGISDTKLAESGFLGCHWHRVPSRGSTTKQTSTLSPLPLPDANKCHSRSGTGRKRLHLFFG